jgi:hypothetical protein
LLGLRNYKAKKEKRNQPQQSVRLTQQQETIFTPLLTPRTRKKCLNKDTYITGRETVEQNMIFAG